MIQIKESRTFSSGVFCTAVTGLHCFLGGKAAINPLFELFHKRQINDKPKILLHACWHAVSLWLGVSSVAFIARGLGQTSISLFGQNIISLTPETIDLIKKVNYMFALYMATFTIGSEKHENRGLISRFKENPQSFLFFLIAWLA